MARPTSSEYDKRSRLILQRAARLYAEQGYRGSPVSMIAKACRISKSLVYHYFHTKEEILYRVMAAQVAAMMKVAEGVRQEEIEPRAKAKMLVERLMHLRPVGFLDYPLPISEIRHLLPNQRDRLLRSQHSLLSAIESILAAGRAPEYAIAANTNSIATAFLGLIESMPAWRRHVSDIDEEVIVKLLAHGVISESQGSSI